ncbi:MAG: 50S ribosomal protein L9 [Rickettsiales bacterium]|jgi:large subunit ribosomal protein L9|nr:50S ribosomal protein L9 [Rickettsiales bacterium]
MKIILTEKISKLGGIGDTVEVATGYARNYLLPKGKAMRFSKENLAVFENKKAELIARHESAKKSAEASLPSLAAAKLHLIRSAGDTGHLYGSVSSRDIAKLIFDLTKIELLSEQVLLSQPIKEIGAWGVKIALHPDVIADVKIYVAQTQDEIDALVAGKDIRKERKLGEQSADAESPAVAEPAIAEPSAVESTAAESASAEPAAAEQPAEQSEPAATAPKKRAKKSEKG